MTVTLDQVDERIRDAMAGLIPLIEDDVVDAIVAGVTARDPGQVSAQGAQLTALIGTVDEVFASYATVTLDSDPGTPPIPAAYVGDIAAGNRALLLHKSPSTGFIIGNLRGTGPGGGTPGGGADSSLFLKVFNVDKYGAGDVSTVADSTVAIQAAIDAAITAGGGIVWFTPGKHYAHAGTLYVHGPHVRLESATGLSATLRPLAGIAYVTGADVNLTNGLTTITSATGAFTAAMNGSEITASVAGLAPHTIFSYVSPTSGTLSAPFTGTTNTTAIATVRGCQVYVGDIGAGAAVNDTVIHNLGFQPAGTPASANPAADAIKLENAHQVRVEDCHFFNINGWCVLAQSFGGDPTLPASSTLWFKNLYARTCLQGFRILGSYLYAGSNTVAAHLEACFADITQSGECFWFEDCHDLTYLGGFGSSNTVAPGTGNPIAGIRITGGCTGMHFSSADVGCAQQALSRALWIEPKTVPVGVQAPDGVLRPRNIRYDGLLTQSENAVWIDDADVGITINATLSHSTKSAVVVAGGEIVRLNIVTSLTGTTNGNPNGNPNVYEIDVRDTAPQVWINADFNSTPFTNVLPGDTPTVTAAIKCTAGNAVNLMTYGNNTGAPLYDPNFAAPRGSGVGVGIGSAGIWTGKVNGRTTLDQYGSSFFNMMTFRSARGTSAAPTQLLASDPVGGAVKWGGYGTTIGFMDDLASIGPVTRTALDATHAGTDVVLKTTPLGAAAWVSGGPYIQGAKVVSGGNIYIALVANTSTVAPTDGLTWRLVGAVTVSDETFRWRAEGGLFSGDTTIAAQQNGATWAFVQPGVPKIPWFNTIGRGMAVVSSTSNFVRQAHGTGSSLNHITFQPIMIFDPESDPASEIEMVTECPVAMNFDKHHGGNNLTAFQSRAHGMVCNDAGIFAGNSMSFIDYAAADRYRWDALTNYFALDPTTGCTGDQVVYNGSAFECMIDNFGQAPTAGSGIPAIGALSAGGYWKHIGAPHIDSWEHDYDDDLPILRGQNNIGSRLTDGGARTGGGINSRYHNTGSNDVETAIVIYSDGPNAGTYLDGLVASTNPKVPAPWTPDGSQSLAGVKSSGAGWRIGQIVGISGTAAYGAGTTYDFGALVTSGGRLFHERLSYLADWSSNDAGPVTTSYAIGEYVVRSTGGHWHLYKNNTGGAINAGQDPASGAPWTDLGANVGRALPGGGLGTTTDFWEDVGPDTDVAKMWRCVGRTPRKTIELMSWAAGVMTVTTTAAHGFQVGDNVAIVGNLNPAYNTWADSQYHLQDGQPKVASVIDATNFTIAGGKYPTDPGVWAPPAGGSPKGYAIWTNSQGYHTLVNVPPGSQYGNQWNVWNPNQTIAPWNHGVRRYFLWLGPYQYGAGTIIAGSPDDVTPAPLFAVDAFGNLTCNNLTVNGSGGGGGSSIPDVGTQTLTASSDQLLHTHDVLELTTAAPLALNAPPLSGTIANASNNAKVVTIFNRSASKAVITLFDQDSVANTNLQLGALSRQLFYGGSITLIWVSDTTGGGGLSYWHELEYSSGVGPVVNAPTQVYSTGMFGNKWPNGLWDVSHVANLEGNGYDGSGALSPTGRLGQYLNYSPDLYMPTTPNPFGQHTVMEFAHRSLVRSEAKTVGPMYTFYDHSTFEAQGGSTVTGATSSSVIISRNYVGSGGFLTGGFNDIGITLGLRVTGQATVDSRIGIHGLDAVKNDYIVPAFSRNVTVQCINGLGLAGTSGNPYPFTYDEYGAHVTGAGIGASQFITGLDGDDGTGHFNTAIINNGTPTGAAFDGGTHAVTIDNGGGSTYIGETLTTQTFLKIDALTAAGNGSDTVNRGIDNAASLWQSGGAHFGSAGQLFVATTGAITTSSTGGVRSTSPTGGIGYGTGAGLTATQLTSKSTTVTNAGSAPSICGRITTHNASLAAGAIVSFTFTNSAIKATDVISCNHVSGGTIGAYTIMPQAQAGSIRFTIRNNTGGALPEALVISYATIPAVTA